MAARTPRRTSERVPMSRNARQRLSFFLLIGVTLYAALVGG